MRQDLDHIIRTWLAGRYVAVFPSLGVNLPDRRLLKKAFEKVANTTAEDATFENEFKLERT